MEGLYHLKDLDTLLDQVLLQARRLTNADAGSIYTIENRLLRFSYIHNDSLFSPESSSKYLYSNHTLPIDDQSLAGYVALTGEPLIIDDAYQLPPALPFTFNKSFDEQSGYRTQTIIAVPLRTSRRKIVGVLQLINALGEGGEVVPFTDKRPADPELFRRQRRRGHRTGPPDPGSHPENDQDGRTAGP